MKKNQCTFIGIFIFILGILSPLLIFAQENILPDQDNYQAEENYPADMPPFLQEYMQNGTSEQPPADNTPIPGKGEVIVAPQSDNTVSANAKENIIDTLDFKEMPILDVLKLIAQKSGLNIVASQNVRGNISVYLKQIKVLDALKVIVSSYGWAYEEEAGNIIKVMTAEEYEQRYAKKFGRDVETRIKQVFYAKASDIAVSLAQVKTTLGTVIADDKSGTLILKDEPETLDRMQKMIDQMDVPVINKVFRLSYAKAVDIAPKIEPALTPNVGTLKFDERSNTIVVSDIRRKLNDLTTIIEAMDRKDKEVLIEAKIVQVTLDSSHKAGVDWVALLNKYGDQSVFRSAFGLLETDDNGVLSGGSVKIGSFPSDNYEVLLEALDTAGSTNVLSNPHVTTVNNKEAKILVGSNQPYVTSQTITPGSGASTTSESVNFIEVGVKLYVTPQIHEDDFITMQIKPEISEVASRVTTSTNNEIPVVQTSQAETTVTVKNGVTIVIGGLMKDLVGQNRSFVPILGRIPFLGALFRSDSDSTQKTELVIFLTPTIITGDVPTPSQQAIEKRLEE